MLAFGSDWPVVSCDPLLGMQTAITGLTLDGDVFAADQTLTVDFKLLGAVALEAMTIVATEVPIVPRDQVATKSIVTGEDIDQLPVDRPQDIVMLQPGVVECFEIGSLPVLHQGGERRRVVRRESECMAECCR